MTQGSQERMDDRRRVARIPVELRIEYRRMKTFVADYTRNLSRGGLFIRTPRPLAKGTRFSFQLALPGRSAPCCLQGEVSWTQPAGPESGMGVRLLWREAGAKAAFEQMVESLAIECLGAEEAARRLADGVGGVRAECERA